MTQAHHLTIDDFEVEPSGHYSELDILCRINGYLVGIHLSYHGRPMIGGNENFSAVSIVDIDLEPLQDLYDSFDHKEHESFKSLVMDYVLNIGHRSWVTHARYIARYSELTKKLNSLVEESNLAPPRRHIAKSLLLIRFSINLIKRAHACMQGKLNLQVYKAIGKVKISSQCRHINDRRAFAL